MHLLGVGESVSTCQSVCKCDIGQFLKNCWIMKLALDSTAQFCEIDLKIRNIYSMELNCFKVFYKTNVKFHFHLFSMELRSCILLKAI